MRILRVGKNHEYKTIEGACFDARPGDVVWLSPEIHKMDRPVNIPRGVTLDGGPVMLDVETIGS